MKKFFSGTRHLGPVRHGGDRREPVPHVLFLQHLLSPVQSGGIIASPFRSAYTAVTGWITDKQNYYQDVTALEEENAALRRENAILKAQKPPGSDQQ